MSRGTKQLAFQVQQLRLTCLPDRVLLQTLVDEAEKRLINGGSPTTVLLYGVSPKRREGFIILETTRGVPPAVRQWLEADARILDYIVNGVERCFQQREALPAEFYQSHLPAPMLPEGYAPLADPMSIDLPSDERWLGLVSGSEGVGMLFYEEQRPLFFLTSEESLCANFHFSRMAETLLGYCASGFVQAHTGDLATLLRDPMMHTNPAEEVQKDV